MRHSSLRRSGIVGVAAVALVLLLAACGRNMSDSPDLRPYQATPFFADGSGMQVPPENTVSREFGALDPAFLSGLDASGNLLTELPVELNEALLQRGMERYNIYCSMCHGYDGAGSGVVVQRGFPQPNALTAEHLRSAPVGYFYQAMTNGFGRMYSYASRVPAGDRWAIAAYIRALQLSQGADPADLPVGVTLDMLLEALDIEAGGQF